MKSATRLLVSTFGGLIGLIGIEHGLGEVLQGNTMPGAIMILSWPQSNFFRVLGGEPALTVVPNLLITGILAILASLLYLVWAIRFIERKHGGLVLMLLSIPMLLFGGGIFPPILGILVGGAAMCIHAPLTWLRPHLSEGRRALLARLWPWLFFASLSAWLGMFPGVPSLDYFFGVSDTQFVLALIACMFVLPMMTCIAGFARDLPEQTAV